MKKNERKEGQMRTFGAPEMEIIIFETDVLAASGCNNVGCPGVCENVCNPYCEIVK